MPALMEELVEEILLRLPPQEPAHLVRAALVCKAWRTMLCDSSSSGFLRRYREFHGASPLLGYLHNTYHRQSRFVPATSAALPPRLSTPALSGKSNGWVRALDCRHGRVLFVVVSSDSGSAIRFIVWDPINRGTKHLKVPDAHWRQQSFTAAVLCAIDGCDHLDCHGGPFRVVLVALNVTAYDEDEVGWATVYSSETQAWSAASPSIALGYGINEAPSLLIGDALYFTIASQEAITNVLKYDLNRHELSMIRVSRVPRGAVAMKTEDGELGFVFLSRKRKRLYLVSWQATGSNGAGRWAYHRTIELETVFLPEYPCKVIGHADGTDTILVKTDAGVFTLDLKSRQSRKVGQKNDSDHFVPYTSFFTPDLAKGRLSPL